MVCACAYLDKDEGNSFSGAGEGRTTVIFMALAFRVYIFFSAGGGKLGWLAVLPFASLDLW